MYIPFEVCHISTRWSVCFSSSLMCFLVGRWRSVTRPSTVIPYSFRCDRPLFSPSNSIALEFLTSLHYIDRNIYLLEEHYNCVIFFVHLVGLPNRGLSLFVCCCWVFFWGGAWWLVGKVEQLKKSFQIKTNEK